MVPRARGLALGYTLSPAGAGLRISIVWYPGLADSPWATRFRLLARACGFRSYGTQGSRTRPGLHAFARWRGLTDFDRMVPSARGLALGYTLSPAGAGSCYRLFRYPGLADSVGYAKRTRKRIRLWAEHQTRSDEVGMKDYAATSSHLLPRRLGCYLSNFSATAPSAWQTSACAVVLLTRRTGPQIDGADTQIARHVHNHQSNRIQLLLFQVNSADLEKRALQSRPAPGPLGAHA